LPSFRTRTQASPLTNKLFPKRGILNMAGAMRTRMGRRRVYFAVHVDFV
jgi:hypothetical protein